MVDWPSPQPHQARGHPARSQSCTRKPKIKLPFLPTTYFAMPEGEFSIDKTLPCSKYMCNDFPVLKHKNIVELYKNTGNKKCL